MTAWQRIGTDGLLRVDADRFVLVERGRARIARVVRPSPLTVRLAGVIERWTVAIEGDELTLARDGHVAAYRRLARIPEELLPRPLPVAPAVPLPPQRIEEIRATVARFRELEMQGKGAELRDEITAWLEQTIAESGWIDAARFGEHTAFAATVLAKHTASLTLLAAILPFVEADFRHAGPRAQAYAITYDEVRLFEGEKQKYGTQFCGSSADPYVCPMADPEHVDALREEIGLEPLASYLEDASRTLYGGRPIRMPSAEENL